MSRRLAYTVLAVVVIAVLVWLAGAAMVEPAARRGVVVGAVLGGAWQVLLLCVLGVALPGNPLIAHGVGMLARLAMVVAAALVLVPVADLPAAPTLLTLVTVLFATTLIEPVAFSAGARNKNR